MVSTAIFYLLLVLVALKVFPELRVRPPYEWAGELASMVVMLLVATVGAGALWMVGL